MFLGFSQRAGRGAAFLGFSLRARRGAAFLGFSLRARSFWGSRKGRGEARRLATAFSSPRILLSWLAQLAAGWG